MNESKAYNPHSRWKDIEVIVESQGTPLDGRLVAVTKLGVFPKRAFWVTDALYQEYLEQGGEPVERGES